MSAALAKPVGPLNMVFTVQFRREPHRARGDRAPPEADVGGVDQAEVSGHVDSDDPVTLGTLGVVNTLPFI